jgi:hypothetical protein
MLLFHEDKNVISIDIYRFIDEAIMLTSKTPQKKIDVPAGYIYIHEKWQGSPIAQEVYRKRKSYVLC